MTIFHSDRLIIIPTTKQQQKTHFVYNNALAASPGASAKSFEKIDD